MSVKKAIIPAAGLGTRFLPATKAQPKEMLPIVDKPTIQYIIEEAVQSGIEDILIITGRGKRAIEDHFDHSPELEFELTSKGKGHLIKEIRAISDTVEIHYIRQKEPRGLGHAIYCARSFINNEPFAVMLGDDVAVCGQPALSQLIHVYEQYKSTVLGVSSVDPAKVSSYGVIRKDEQFHSHKNVYKVTGLVEKPPAGEAPSNIAIFGRYVITPAIFDILAETQPGTGGEIQLTDALRTLAQTENMYAIDFEGKRYDVGSKQGFLRATVDFALARDDLRKDFADYLNTLHNKGAF